MPDAASGTSDRLVVLLAIESTVTFLAQQMPTVALYGDGTAVRSRYRDQNFVVEAHQLNEETLTTVVAALADAGLGQPGHFTDANAEEMVDGQSYSLVVLHSEGPSLAAGGNINDVLNPNLEQLAFVRATDLLLAATDGAGEPLLQPLAVYHWYPGSDEVVDWSQIGIEPGTHVPADGCAMLAPVGDEGRRILLQQWSNPLQVLVNGGEQLAFVRPLLPHEKTCSDARRTDTLSELVPRNGE